MRWERLFDDLEAQLEGGARDEFDAEVADRTRREVARVRLFDRIRSAGDRPLRLTVIGAGNLGGTVRRVGQGWLLIEIDQGDAVVTEPAILAVEGLAVAATEPGSAVEARTTIGHILRALARDRSPVRIVLRDGSPVAGTIDRVGADFIDLAEHAADEPRRPAAVSAHRTLAFAAISTVRPG
jgi:hypothetical protein